MMGMLAGKVLCRLRVYSVDVWEYRQNAVCTQYGTCRWCGALREQVKHEYPRRGGKVARKPAPAANAGRPGVRASPTSFSGDLMAAAEMVVG